MLHPGLFPAVLELEERYARDPISPPVLEESFHSLYTKGVVGITTNNTIISYLVFDTTKYSINIRSLLVLPQFRRSENHWGSRVLEFLTSLPALQMYKQITAVVPEDMLVEQQFLRANGFKTIKTLRGQHGELDEYVFVRPLRYRVTRHAERIENVKA
jgi:hypothetical protein